MKLKQVETTAPLLLETCTACCSPGSSGPMTDYLDEILLEEILLPERLKTHTSRTYDQVHGDLLDLKHDAPTAQPAVQQEPPRRPVSVCGNPVECVGRPADPVRAPATLPETSCPDPGTLDPGTHQPHNMGVEDQQRRQSQRLRH